MGAVGHGIEEGSLTGIDEQRQFFARMMARASGSTDPRLERIFELVPREAFLDRGPWKIHAFGEYIETPNADLRYVYQDTVIALDADKGINNGGPFLHARWIGAVAPQAGETITHIGAGTGYYTAILSMLVRPGGCVHAFEIEPELSARARVNLEPFDNVHLNAGDANAAALERSDIIYVNAHVAAPPIQWMKALGTSGRMILPWQPVSARGFGVALLMTRHETGFEAVPVMAARFIPCAGISFPKSHAPLEPTALWRVRSAHLCSARAPDETAIAIYDDVWLSTARLCDSVANG